VRAGFETTGDPGSYIQAIMTWTLVQDGDTGTLSGSFLGVCVAQGGCPQGRTMVPPPIASPVRPVAADGSFMLPIVGQLPGAANPFSGTPQPLDGVLVGTIESADLACGTVTGTAAGLPLAGSTWAAIRITDTSATGLPPPLAHCPDIVMPDAGVPDAAVDAAVDAATDAAIDAT